MELLQSCLKSFVYFGSGLSFLYCFLEWTKKRRANRTLIFVTFLTGATLLRYAWYFDRLYFISPYLFLFLYTGVSSVGPVLWSYVNSRLVEEWEEADLSFSVRRQWPHLIPAVLFAFSEILFFTQDSERLRELMSSSQKEFSLDWIHLAAILASIQVSSYSVACLWIYHKVSRKYEIYELKLVWVVLLLPVVANSFIGAAFFLKNMFLFELGAGCVSMILVLMFVLRERNPDFFDEMRTVIRNSKYQNTALLPQEIKQADEKLRRIMEEEFVYRDSELRLGDLAAGLGLSLHQTSRYLNEIQRMTFYELINRYRVQEACKLLLSQADKSVLEVGFEVGFNSKSAFNSQFVRAMGVSPGIYRKNKSSSPPKT
ncbi:AraC family transcriptional regulator [Leptospira fletcheri]|uniref:AraC family transcriptional regulator n=1 Tax=Leptospira fletcheri TaxID=2484981 RepID=A0A4R9GCP7_9LEPT|nr:helix-turn-helix domain-containing protein [Leptospira fletcheri]TGK08787.1 AraC family transcriptional regulator [Leptospira fletcheri]